MTETPASHCLERTTGRQPRGEEPASDTDSKQTTELQPQPIRCRRCRQQLSTTEALFAMQGDRVERVFANPNGFLHEVITLLHAHGLRAEGPPTTEFSWFPGYAWEMAYCDACASHVGWQFGALDSQAAPENFWGLRKSAIVFGDET